MIIFIIYLTVAIILGFVLELNYDFDFTEFAELNTINHSDLEFWLVILLWPLCLSYYVLAYICSLIYRKLYDYIEEIKKKD